MDEITPVHDRNLGALVLRQRMPDSTLNVRVGVRAVIAAVALRAVAGDAYRLWTSGDSLTSDRVGIWAIGLVSAAVAGGWALLLLRFRHSRFAFFDFVNGGYQRTDHETRSCPRVERDVT